MTTQQRSLLHEAICDDYFDQGLSLTDLEAKYRRSGQTLRRIINPQKKAGRERTKQAVDRRSVINADPLTPLHRRIAMRVVRWRTITNNYSVVEACEHLGISFNRLHTIEGGIHNWTLRDLVLIAEQMGTTVQELIREPHEGDYQSPTTSSQ